MDLERISVSRNSEKDILGRMVRVSGTKEWKGKVGAPLGLEGRREKDEGLILRDEMMLAHYTSHFITQKPGKDARDREEN